MKNRLFVFGRMTIVLTIAALSVFLMVQAVSAASQCFSPPEQCQQGCAKYLDAPEAYDFCVNDCNTNYTSQADWDAYLTCQQSTAVQTTTTSTAPVTVKTLVIGTDVHEGDIINTGANEIKIIAFSDGSKVQIGRNSSFTYNTQDLVTTNGLGKFAFYLKKLTDFRLRKFTVRTPTVALAVRGTYFLVDTGANGETTVKMLEGTLDVSDIGNTKTVQVQAGYQLTVDSNGVFGSQTKLQLTPADNWYKDVQPFSDVGIDHKFFDAIGYLKNNNIVQGYSDGTFKPSSEINRAEFTKIVIATIATGPVGSACFTDVKGEWFAPYVCYAKKNGIIGGYPDGTFKPTQSVKMAEALKIILLALHVSLSKNTGSNWYDVYMNTANELVILANISDATPAHIVNRGEMAEMIYRLKAL